MGTSKDSPVINSPAQRLDVWLYRTRLMKTRSAAAKLIQSGKVRLTRNHDTLRTRKAHTLIRPGDSLAFMRGQTLLHVEVLAPCARRGPASEARTHYTLVEVVSPQN